jgi:hypothetical protein
MDEKYSELAQRVASLEARAERGAEDRKNMQLSLDQIQRTQQQEAANLAQLVNKISRWEGKFGGVLFIVGCLWAFLTGLPEVIVTWIKTFGGIK